MQRGWVWWVGGQACLDCARSLSFAPPQKCVLNTPPHQAHPPSRPRIACLSPAVSAVVDLGYTAAVGSVAVGVGASLPAGATARFLVHVEAPLTAAGAPTAAAGAGVACGAAAVPRPGGWAVQACNQTGR